MGFGLGDLNPFKSGSVLNPANWSIGGNSLKNASIGGTNIGQYIDPASSYNRNAAETAATLYADFYTGGLASFANGWQSKGSQAQLGTNVGKAAQIGAGIGGLATGNTVFQNGVVSGGGTPASAAPAASSADYYQAGVDGPAYSSAAADTAAAVSTQAVQGNGTSAAPQSVPPGGMTSTGATTPGEASSMGVGANGASAAPVSPPAPPPAAPAAAAGWGSTALKYGPLALMALSSGQKPQQTPQQQQASGIANTQQQVGQGLINQYNNGTLSGADAYNVAQWEQQQTQATKDYYARAGLSDSSMAQQAISGIQAQAASMRTQALQNYLSQGMSALGGAAGTLSPIIQAQINADQQAQQAQQNFLQTMAQMNAKGA